ncbi:MAG: hypothetical protein JO317_03905, partial [Verrucomicrobiae bacterium]|nr:hypothetical protein [Verrucomicrobiae bacterium]
NGSGIAGHGAIRNVSGNNSISGNTTLASATTLGSDANTLTMSGIISGAQNMTVTGAGTVKFTGNNTYSGSTTINGTLEAGAAGALGGTSGIVLNTGGTLLFSGVGNRVRDLATFNFAGGNLKGSDLTEAMGALTLSANSTLDFVKDATRGDITFASGLLSGTPVLTINNWSGKIYAGGTDDRLFMTVAPTQAFLDSIQFTGFNRGAYWIPGTGEIVPVPEPGTILAATALLLLLGLQVLSENHSYVPALVGALRRRRPRR